MNTPENPNCKFICKDRYIRKLADGSIDVIDGNQKVHPTFRVIVVN